VWEVTFAADGRATFEYGDEVIESEAHIIWRRPRALLDRVRSAARG
jgi:hypothetical protein